MREGPSILGGKTPAVPGRKGLHPRGVDGAKMYGNELYCSAQGAFKCMYSLWESPPSCIQHPCTRPLHMCTVQAWGPAPPFQQIDLFSLSARFLAGSALLCQKTWGFASIASGSCVQKSLNHDCYKPRHNSLTLSFL